MPRTQRRRPTERQERVLAAIVAEHIQTGQPVGSKTTRERHGIAASSATIRNEMVELTELGLIHQPHTSAGRVPTDVGLRYFVEHLMDSEPLGLREKAWVKSEFRRNVSGGPDAMREGARLLASLVEAPAVVMSPREPSQQLRHFVASPVSSRNVLLVYVTGDGHVENRLVELPEPVTQRQLERMSEVFNRLFAGAEVSALSRFDLQLLAREMGELSVSGHVAEAVRRGLEREQAHDIYIDGAIYVLQDPEFARAAGLQRIMETLYQQRLVSALLKPLTDERSICIRIGTENPGPHARSLGVVAMAYDSPDGGRGVVAAVGPRRMPYWRAVPAVMCVAEELGEHLSQDPER